MGRARARGLRGRVGFGFVPSDRKWAVHSSEQAVGPPTQAVFSFLYLKKIKISKIYVGFGKFQKYTPVALWGATGLKCNFFKFATKSLEKKKEGACRPPNGRQAPVAHPRGDRVLL